MNKLDKVTFTPVTHFIVRWICASKVAPPGVLGMGRSKFAAYRDYEVRLNAKIQRGEE